MGRYVLHLLALIFFVYSVGTSLTQVQPGERAVIRRFGRILDRKPEPGLYIGLPWGIDQVTIVRVSMERSIKVGFKGKQDKEEDVVPAGQLLTGDHNLVNVQAVILYKVRENAVEKFVLQANNIDALVARATESLLAEWIAGRKVDDVLLRGKIELPRFLRDELQQRLEQYEIGLDVERASVTELFPPEEVKDAFDRVAQAQTNIQTRLNQAKQEAGKKQSEANEQKFHMQRLAQAYANSELINANAEAASFRTRLTQYRQLSRANPDYLNAMWLDEMTRLFAKMKDGGRIELLDHFLTSEGITITQFPLQPRKK